MRLPINRMTPDSASPPRASNAVGPYVALRGIAPYRGVYIRISVHTVTEEQIEWTCGGHVKPPYPRNGIPLSVASVRGAGDGWKDTGRPE